MTLDIHDSVGVSIGDVMALPLGTLLIMQASALRGIVDSEFEVLDLEDRLTNIRNKKVLTEMSEKIIGKVIARKKREADFAFYLRTGRFPDGA